MDRPGEPMAPLGSTPATWSGRQDSTGKPPWWQRWLVPVAMIVAAPLAILLPNTLSGGDAAKAPEDFCAVIPRATLTLLVPKPKVTRSEADNDGPYTVYAYCDVDTDTETATSNAEGSLSVSLERHGSVGTDSPERSARDSFVSSKEYHRDDGDKVLDIPRLGDSTYAVIAEVPEYDKTRRSVQVEVLAGSDTFSISYHLSPTSDELALAGAVAGARSIIKGLSS